MDSPDPSDRVREGLPSRGSPAPGGRLAATDGSTHRPRPIAGHGADPALRTRGNEAMWLCPQSHTTETAYEMLGKEKEMGIWNSLAYISLNPYLSINRLNAVTLWAKPGACARETPPREARSGCADRLSRSSTGGSWSDKSLARSRVLDGSVFRNEPKCLLSLGGDDLVEDRSCAMGRAFYVGEEGRNAAGWVVIVEPASQTLQVIG
jgi:hypothetical protein